ncbi:ATP-dependent RNA helicase RhlE [Loktanella sp. PT4BL]|jgi:ATP-dependent RNA helicase RhlE|uniref:DEAD/DEAH box helicase n=1 Tax=Loktanella sp. PT4BL TaxID=2135611 RepID=UPI000D75BE49|nr:DEAD/DEAH box helicase [Loktanella sp. PT4BL]PXW68810.1 ATP-dependent RNA helicase RhlE [Loktanella sp. PT4BL]
MDFDMLGLAPRLVNVLKEQGITDPTPIQTQAIPHAMNGRDVMGLAQTGSGKTAAFGLPMIHALLKAGVKPNPKTTRGLILAPTRELAKQISDNLTAYTKGSHLKVALVVGGAGIVAQTKRLAGGVDLLVATPGRLIDLLDRRAVRLDETIYLVLDEADQMLDMGFIHALRRIAPLLAKERQTMMFSATMPKLMSELAGTYLTDAVRVQVNPPGQAVKKINQSVHFVAQAAKTDLLIELLDKHRDELAIVFGRTKHGCEKLYKVLEKKGFAAASIHGNKSQGQRQRALDAFKAGKTRVLVATDVAARGLDIPDVRFVYNYDLPNVAENYVHRIGRTARAGADGSAVALVAPDEMIELQDIEKAMKDTIPVASGRPWEVQPGQKKRPNGGGGGGRRGGGGGQRSGAPRAAGKPAGGQGKPAGRRRGGGGGRARSQSAA